MPTRSHTAQRSGPPGPGEWRDPRAWIAALALAAVGAIAYGNSLHGPFIFDDYPSIETNATIRHLSPITDVLQTRRETPTPLAGRPLANLSFALNYAFGGLNVEGYHGVNVALHLLAGVALFGVLRRAFKAAGVVRPPSEAADATAFICSLIWVVHPLNSEAVDYATQRTESMAGLLWLFTLYASIRAWDARHSRMWQALAVTACACGIATKESVVTAPLMVILYDRVFVCDSFRTAFRRRGRLYVALACCWLMFAVLVWQTPFFRHETFYSPGGGFGARISSWTYLLNQAPIIVRYLRLSLFPRGLVLDYGAPAALSLRDVWPSALLVLALLALTIAALPRLPRVGFWGAWFFLTLAPASSFVPIPTEVGAERRMYVPLVAVIVLVVLAVQAGLRYLAHATNHKTAGDGPARDGSAQAGHHSPAKAAHYGWLETIVAAVVVIGLVVATRERNAEYQSAVTIWETVIERRPNARAHANLAAVLGEAGRADEAIAHLRLAAPEFVDARRLLGLELLVRRENREAITQLSEFARLAPDDPDILQVRKALAAAFIRVGDTGSAKRELEAIAARAPEDASGHLDLGDVLLSSGDIDGAVRQYRESLRLRPGDVEILTRIERALVSVGGSGESIDALRASVRANLARVREK